MNKVIETFDIIVIEGHRSVAVQQEYYKKGRFGNPGPIVTQIDGVKKKGKHNYDPAKAVDVAPYPINWNDREQFVYMAGLILGIAHVYGINLRWGGDWDEDHNLIEEKFRDLPHFEVVD